MEYLIQAFKDLKNLVHAEANRRAQKTGFFVAFLTQTRFLLNHQLKIACKHPNFVREPF